MPNTQTGFRGSTDDNRFSLVIPAEVLEHMLVICHAANDLETGGILVGSYSKDHRTALVASASGPPPDTKSGSSWLLRGVRGLRRWLAELWRQEHQYYLGEWHYHPGGSPIPSSIDLEQMVTISSDDKYKCPEPLLVIIGEDQQGEWDCQAWVFPVDEEALELRQVGAVPGY